MSRGSRRLDYSVSPFEGASSPPGVSEDAARRLAVGGFGVELSAPHAETTRGPERRGSDEVREPAPTLRNARGSAEDRAPTPKTATEAGVSGAPARYHSGTRAARAAPVEAGDGRTQRTMRFTTGIDQKLRELAEMRGIDLNAAVSAAICEDWHRLCSSRDRGPR